MTRRVKHDYYIMKGKHNIFAMSIPPSDEHKDKLLGVEESWRSNIALKKYKTKNPEV